MLIEIEQRHHTDPIRNVIDDCLKIGYAGFFIAGRQLQPIDAFDASMHQDEQAIKGNRAAYINNFIFKPA